MKGYKNTLLVSLLLLPTLLMSCGSGENDYDASGAFEAMEVLVSAQANGEILSLELEEGTLLQAGQPVGVIDTTQLYLQKMALLSSNQGLQVQRPNIDTQISVLNEQLETLRTERERVKNLLEADVATQKQLDDIDNQIRILESQIGAQTSTLRKSSASITAQSSAVEVQIAQVDEQLRKSIITSPITGVVLRQYAQPGELAAMGMPLFRVANIDELDLRAYITNDQLAQVRLGDTVEVRVDDGTGSMRSYEGTIKWIASEAEFTPKTIQTKDERANLVYAIKVKVLNDGYLKIGMYGEVVLPQTNK